jgi:branched-chain amino acid transport system ATP-binding protein
MLIEIEQLTAGYGKNEVLHDVHFHLRVGEVVGLIGPNGAGKSTILKSIFGLATIRHGRIRFQGGDIINEPTHSLLAKGLAYVPQGRLVFPSLTVEENMRLGGYTLPTRGDVNDRMEDLFERFPTLLPLRTRRAGALSGGQQQLVAITRALMISPTVLMLDEPSLGLSPVICSDIYAALETLRADGVSLLIVEQNVHLVLEHATRIVALSGGRVRADDAPATFRDPDRLRKLYLQ